MFGAFLPRSASVSERPSCGLATVSISASVSAICGYWAATSLSAAPENAPCPGRARRLSDRSWEKLLFSRRLYRSQSGRSSASRRPHSVPGNWLRPQDGDGCAIHPAPAQIVAGYREGRRLSSPARGSSSPRRCCERLFIAGSHGSFDDDAQARRRMNPLLGSITRRRKPGSCLPRKQESPVSGAFARLRGKDSNLDYLIQSQASYR